MAFNYDFSSQLTTRLRLMYTKAAAEFITELESTINPNSFLFGILVIETAAYVRSLPIDTKLNSDFTDGLNRHIAYLLSLTGSVRPCVIVYPIGNSNNNNEPLLGEQMLIYITPANDITARIFAGEYMAETLSMPIPHDSNYTIERRPASINQPDNDRYLLIDKKTGSKFALAYSVRIPLNGMNSQLLNDIDDALSDVPAIESTESVASSRFLYTTLPVFIGGIIVGVGAALLTMLYYR